jgi:hypothetical protein
MTDDVTKFWDAIRAKWPEPVVPLHNVHLHEQMLLIEAINTILTVLNNNKGRK